MPSLFRREQRIDVYNLVFSIELESNFYQPIRNSYNYEAIIERGDPQNVTKMNKKFFLLLEKECMR